MKRLLLFLALQAGLITRLDAQEVQTRIYGKINANGNEMTGGYYSIYADGTGYTVKQFSEETVAGEQPNGEIMKGNDGRLYGTTTYGGDNAAGVLYSVKPDGTEYRVVHHFESASGSSPYGRLIQLTSGELIGVTYDGGANGLGTLYKVTPDGSAYQVLRSFDASAPYPYDVVQASNGKIYGVSYGTDGDVLFVVEMDGSGFQVLRQFPAGSSGYLNARLVEGSDGFLYSSVFADYETTGLDQGYIFKVTIQVYPRFC